MTILEALRVTTERIKAWVESKFVNINHGKDNADKILSIGADGTVVPTTNIVYVGSIEPVDPDVKVWINTAEDGTGVVPVLPRISTISLPASEWIGSSSPYSQTVTINTVTPVTKIELNPTVTQIVSLQDDDIALMAQNDEGTVTVYSFGGKPSGDITMQVTLTEVSYV